MKLVSDDILAHYGILGMKWGVRRYQNKDGTLTAEGKIRDRAANAAAKNSSIAFNKNTDSGHQTSSSTHSVGNKIKTLVTKENAKKVAIGAAIVAGTAFAIYGATHYPQLATSAKELMNSGMIATKNVLNTSANVAQKGFSATASVAKTTSKGLKDIKELTDEIQNTLQPKKESKTEEVVSSAANELSGKVTDKVSERSKTAGVVAGSVTNAAVTAIGNKLTQDNSSDHGLTLDPKESFNDADMAKLLSSLDQMGKIADAGSKVLDSVGNGADNIASDLLRRIGDVRLN